MTRVMMEGHRDRAPYLPFADKFLTFTQQLEDTMDQQANTLPQPVPVTSFAARAAGIFSSPGEVFNEVAAAPVQSSSWTMPLIFSLLITVLFTFVLFNNPSLRQQVLEPQQQKMQKQVEEGKMTQEQYDRASSMMESPVMFLAFGVIGSVIFISLAFFGAPLILWLAAKLFWKVPVSYKKFLEVFGLCTLIGVLGAIVTLLLMHLFNSVHASPGGSLLVMNGFDPENTGHKLLSSVTVFGLWQTAVVGLGTSRVTGKSTAAGMGLAFGLWAVWVILSSLLGFAGR
jgi:hypothetical protein